MTKNTLEGKKIHLCSINKFFCYYFADWKSYFGLIFILVTNRNAVGVALATSRTESVKKL
jgi:hypothetical protein